MSSFVVDAIRSAGHRAERIVDRDDDKATARQGHGPHHRRFPARSTPA